MQEARSGACKELKTYRIRMQVSLDMYIEVLKEDVEGYK
jgi:hypothetical protein